MFRIRRVYDNTLPLDRAAIAQVQDILAKQFSGLSRKEIDSLPAKLLNPLKFQFRTLLFVADNHRNDIKGFALVNYAPDLNFSYLDFLSVQPARNAGGIGGALYERVRDEAKNLKVCGIFMECLPDDAGLCRDKETLRQNRARLRFYERYGVVPIINTAYETPLQEGGDCPPYLLFDRLGARKLPGRAAARRMVRAILTRKYGTSCPAGYIDMVVDSFQDDPLRLRPLRYIKTEPIAVRKVLSLEQRIALVINDKHDIHHVNERGYVEAPVRIRSILKGIGSSDLFEQRRVRRFQERAITAVHDPKFVGYLKRVCAKVEPGHSVYPYVFPIRNAARPPKDLPVRAGYYCIDTFTPLNRNAYVAARGAVDCALTCASLLFEGYRLCYALVRPPGHHAERKVFGGFCYFNSTAVAAHYLSRHGKVAVLDIDYHHGNGTQDIFYERADVFTLSIHGHPSFAYPYFSGFADEKGEGPGLHYNKNYPLPEKIDGEHYRLVLGRALKRIQAFSPRFLLVALGYDPAKNDPTGTWSLEAADFYKNGLLIGSLRLPTLIVQEGGYRTRSLGANARSFFKGLWEGMHRP
ncbi:MAG: histone deacetylase family protein [Deltaproteobacteria bacterium]|jgi:acetoin utilization deacetylase AcuC-like enzyme/GNAT superfamily N-acetyltransferase|nr:histone deacetylase family protein [Deltaproteobacteria bacterium]